MDNLSNVLGFMEEYAAKHHIPIISRAGGELMQEIAASCKPSSVLEIGTAIGYSTLLIASAMPPGGQIVTVEQDNARIEVARDFIAQAGVAAQINIIVGDAGIIVPQLTDYFDMVFIDAAKGQYLDYLHKVMDKLSPGAVVIADNVLFRGWVLGSEAPPKRFRTIVKRLTAYLDFVTDSPHFITTIHQIGDGMAISYYQGEK